ncbi:MAG: shikimate dehydrogenase [Myxococcales bacterium]
MRRFYCVLGDPVAHSRSPAIHTRAFALLGIDAVYAPCRVTALDLARAVIGLRALGCAGFNVTVPHKTAMLGLLDDLEPLASRCGAVNCVALDEGTAIGHNTDAIGLLDALDEREVSIGERAVVVGAGGSARAAAFVLAQISALKSVAIVNRSLGAAQVLAHQAREAGARAEAFPLGSDEAKRALREASLVVHCTTVGLSDDSLPFDPALLAPGTALVDLVYRLPGGATALVRAARSRGIHAVDGIDVLVHQAIASLQIWLSRPMAGLSKLAPQLREAALS